MPESTRTSHHRGFSLIEATISITIVSFMVLASMNAVSGAVQSAQRGPETHTATRLLEDLVNEIMAQHYEEPEDDTFTSFNADNGEATPGNRSKFD
ncbi:MAG: prepilin-type N-terminal cleavage/methylation domain-containing protein, partial [Planctomycetota bacterium]